MAQSQGKSHSHLVTIDFLGIGSDGNATENTSTATHCQRQFINRRGIQSCLRKIKPHMLQQVLSDEHLSNPEHSQKELHCGVSEDLKAMELFPQYAAESRSDTKDSEKPFLDTEISISKALNFKAPTKPSSSQLMLFYNGAANVYNVSSDKAKAIITMAAGNGNTANISSSIALSKGLGESVFKLEGSANQRNPLGIAHWKLPLAKKKSLGRFIQKRTARDYFSTWRHIFVGGQCGS